MVLSYGESQGARICVCAEFIFRSRLERRTEAVGDRANTVRENAIANADTGASAYSDVAIDQAWRAAGEILNS
jgi:hypothetical protein